MEKSIALSRKDVCSVLVLDILSGIAMYLIPALSHMVAYPLYYFDPMRVIILLGFLSYRNKWNSAFLAVTLPLVSFLLSGHPVAVKNMIISIELLANIFLLSALLKRNMNTFLAVIVSIAASKILYYGLKFAAIRFALLDTSLVDTSLWYQVGVGIALAGLWWFVESRKCRQSD